MKTRIYHKLSSWKNISNNFEIANEIFDTQDKKIHYSCYKFKHNLAVSFHIIKLIAFMVF
jgi:hypothetical protein